MKNWLIKNSVEIVCVIVVIMMAAVMIMSFDPSEFIISADWLVGTDSEMSNTIYMLKG